MKNTSKNGNFPLLLSFAAAALLLCTPAYAQDKTSEIDKIFNWATPATPGCAVAVSQRGKLVVNRAYGSADLVTWNDALAGGRLGAFVTEKLQEQARLNNGRKLGYARGLYVDSYRGGAMVSHSGGAAGYSAWLGRLPAQGLSIAVLCNEDATSATALARRVGDLFLPASGAEASEAKPPAAVAEGAGVTGLDLNSKAGMFVSERTGDPLLLVVNKGELRIPGLRAALVPVTKDRFRNPSGDLSFMSQDEFELHFLSQDEFELRSMEGQTTRYARAQPFAPTPADLQAFAGRYASDETGSAFRVVPGKDGLVVHLEGSSGKGTEIKPVYRDTFQVSRVTLRFRRDKAGKVVAFDYNNPLLRNIKFARLGDITSPR